MDRRTTGLIATIVSVLLCAVPGLGLLCFGTFFAAGEVGQMDPGAAVATGLAIICVGIVGLGVPFLVGILTLRRKSPAPYQARDDEPIPPPN